MPKKKLGDEAFYRTILIDAMNLCARHDWRPLSYNGEWTGMAYGVIQALMGFRYQYPNASVGMLWDDGGSWREDASAFYKSSRFNKRKSEEHRAFLQRVSKVRGWILRLGVSNISLNDWEADDLAAFLSVYTEKRPVLLVSQDRDWFQLLAEDVHIQCHDKNGYFIYTLYNSSEFLGYPQDKVVLWKMLKGCGSDDIPGIPRLPTKIALQAVKECSDFEQVVQWLYKNGYTRWAEKAKRHNAEEVKTLVSLEADKVPVDSIKIQGGEFDYKYMEGLFKELALHSLLPQLQSLDGELVNIDTSR